MLSMLIAYDESGSVIATLDYLVAKDEEDNAVGLIDFGTHEENGGEMLDVWHVQDAKGSKVWPEWIGARAHDFRVELEGPAGRKRIAALVHKQSGHRRERAVLEGEIERRITNAKGEPADIRDLVGGPDRPLLLHDDGTTKGRTIATGTPKHLPLAGRQIADGLSDGAGNNQPGQQPVDAIPPGQAKQQ